MARTHEVQRSIIEAVIDGQEKANESGLEYNITITFSDNTPNLNVPFGYEFAFEPDGVVIVSNGTQVTAFDIAHVSAALMV